MRLASSRLVAAVCFASIVACSHGDGSRVAQPSSGDGVPVEEIDTRFVGDLKQAFAEYKAWGRVDDELRWAPFLCRMPSPGRPTMSTASEGGHAKKLYSLFAKEHAAYVALGSGNATAPATSRQIVAKESYVPEVVNEPAPNAPPPGAGNSPEADHFHPYTTGEDGKTYRASQLAGVYFVIQKPLGTPGTDEGFVYGTVTASGEVTSAGRVSSCMGCHVSAKHRRFFGPAQRAY
jgi:hypothetical protein